MEFGCFVCTSKSIAQQCKLGIRMPMYIYGTDIFCPDIFFFFLYKSRLPRGQKLLDIKCEATKGLTKIHWLFYQLWSNLQIVTTELTFEFCLILVEPMRIFSTFFIISRGMRQNFHQSNCPNTSVISKLIVSKKRTVDEFVYKLIKLYYSTSFN